MQTSVAEPKIPKSMKYWFRLQGVNFDPKSGCGVGRRRELTVGCARPYRVFRALPHLGLLQICDGYHDRWANSVGAQVSLPATHAEFENAMKNLLADAQLYQVDPSEEIKTLESRLSPVMENIQEFKRELAELEAYLPYSHGAKWLKNSIRYVKRNLARSVAECERIKSYIRFQRARLNSTA